jgi:uncharacterized protein (DUF488 family)
MNRIYTIGHNKKNLRKFIELLRQAKVTKVIDVRLNNTSQLVGFAKKEDLSFILELVGVEYEHVPQLAPTEELRKKFKQDKNWDEYKDAYLRLLNERDALTLLEQSSGAKQVLCLLCSEDKPDRCHRRLLAEYIQSHCPDIEICHL